MKSTKVNVDRSTLSSAEIAGMRNFGGVLSAFEAVKMPFYKTLWFIGSTALVVVGSIGTAIYLDSQDTVTPTSTYEARTTLPDFNDPKGEERLVARAETIIEPEVHTTETTPPESEEKHIEAKDQSIRETPLISNPDDKNTSDQKATETTETVPPKKSGFTVADHWPRIANVLNGTISANTLCTSSGIETIYPYQIKSFSFVSSFLKDGKITATGPKLTSDMCEVIKVLPRGSTIHFQDIVARTEDGQELRLNSLRYIID